MSPLLSLLLYCGLILGVTARFDPASKANIVLYWVRSSRCRASLSDVRRDKDPTSSTCSITASSQRSM